MHARIWLAAALALALVPAPQALAFSGDAANGKLLFMKKGTKDKACMTCHPAGETIGKTPKGKKVPNLITEQMSDAKLVKKSRRFAQGMGLKLSATEEQDLFTYIRSMQQGGFGPVPAEWQAHVAKYVKP